MSEDEALDSGRSLGDAFTAAGWTKAMRYRLSCSGCDYHAEVRTFLEAAHFDGVVDKPGHVHTSEARVVLLSPWVPLDPAEGGEDA